MKFSVIIPTYNDWDRLGKCLISLKKQTIESGQYEVIVVDNSPGGELPNDFSLPEGVQLIHEPRPGSYVARNSGAKIAKGEILAFTDSDCIPDENWLANARVHFEQSACDMLGGKVEIFRNGNIDDYGYLYERHTAFPQHVNVPLGRGVTANLFVKKSIFERLYGFDSRMKSGGDWAFTLKCTKLGYSMVYGEDVLVLHPARSLRTILKKHYRITCGAALNIKNQYGHSYFRILGSHLLHGVSPKREYRVEPSRNERVIVFSIDLLKYIYRTIIHGGLILRLIDPSKARE